MFDNILVAYDGSKHSLLAAEFAVEILKTVPGSKCTLVTVLTFTKEEASFLGAGEEEYQKAQKLLEGKVFGEIKNLFEDNELPLTTLFIEGDPAGEILSYAEKNGVSHIIVGSRGMGGIKGALLGSVSSKIIQQARCPVTVVKESLKGRMK